MIICIGREFGSGGHEIGREIAEKLRLELYDRNLIDKAAEKMVTMPKKVLEKAEEKRHNPWLHQVWYDVPNQELNGMTANDMLYLAYNSIIRELAEKGDCVFVGRCADYLLRIKPDCRCVFITAPLEKRIRTISARTGLDAKAAKQLIKKVDKQRKYYYENYTDRKWGKHHGYDLCLDSSRLTKEQILKILTTLYETIE